MTNTYFLEIEKTKKTAYFVDYNLVQRWIEEFYGFQEYCIPALHEQGNYTDLNLLVCCKKASEELLKEVERYKGKDFGIGWRTGDLLDNMAYHKVIPEGEYVISISW